MLLLLLCLGLLLLLLLLLLLAVLAVLAVLVVLAVLAGVVVLAATGLAWPGRTSLPTKVASYIPLRAELSSC